MILSDPIFRDEISFMAALFLSTVILSGPTWCRHLCYFGAIDGTAAKEKTSKKPIKNKSKYKHSILLFVVLATIILRWLNLNILYAAIFGASFGIIGVLVLSFLSGQRKKMMHCTMYCPIALWLITLSLLNYLESGFKVTAQRVPIVYPVVSTMH